MSIGDLNPNTKQTQSTSGTLVQLHTNSWRLLQLLRYIFDESARIVQLLVSQCGQNGYLLYGILSSIAFFPSSIVIKNYPEIDWSINLMVRGFATWVFSYIISCTNGLDLTLPGRDLFFITARNILIASHQLFFFYIITMIPMKIVWVVMNVGPVFVFIISYFLLGTHLAVSDLFYLLVSVLGVNIISAPQVILEFLGFSSTSIPIELDSTQLFLTFLYFCSHVVWALGIVLTKLSPKSTSISINHNLGMCLTVTGAVACLARSNIISLPSAGDLFFDFTCMACPTFISQLLFIQGMIVAKNPGKFSLTNYFSVFLQYLMQFVVMSKGPTFFEIIGVFLTFFGVYKVIVKPVHKPALNATTEPDPLMKELIPISDEEKADAVSQSSSVR